LPRRHLISAAGALAAALLVAAQAPADAQTVPGTPDAPLGSAGAPGATESDQDQAAAILDALGGWESTTIREPLGGLGDETSGPAKPALGGLGDEPSQAALQAEERADEGAYALQPEETGPGQGSRA
jgi:hypothetical protein